MLSVKEAQEFRRQLAESESRLKDLSQQHHEAKAMKDRAGMMRITKEVNETMNHIESLKTELNNAPVEPWEPERVWDVIEKTFDYQEIFEEDKAKFLKDISVNIGYTLEWRAAKIVQSEKKSDLTKWVVKLGNIENVQERIEKFYTYLPDFIEQLKEDVLRGACRQTSMSTSESSNLVERARLEATAEVLDNLTNWYGSSINRAKKHFESWKELNQE